jgi:hypothetical protein
MLKQPRALWCVDALSFGRYWPNLAAYQRLCDEAYRQISFVKNFRPFDAHKPTVITVVRNEEEILSRFILHYIGLGVETFHIVDNNSSDRTKDIAASFPQVTLWNASGSYLEAAFGQAWVGGLVRKFGLDSWVLNLDVDEFLVYDQYERVPVHELLSVLERSGERRLFTPMIDVYYKEGSWNESMLNTSRCKIQDWGLYFDEPAHDLRGIDLKLEETQFGPRLVGGPRGRIDASRSISLPALSKHALSFWTREVAYANVHYPYPFVDNRQSKRAALIHTKLLPYWHNKIGSILEENQHWNDSVEYRSYSQWINDGESRSKLYLDRKSKEFRGSSDLIQSGLLDPISSFS